METILGLLLVLLPLVFKLVEKKLKASGKVETAEKVHEWAEMFGKDEDWEKDDEDEDETDVDDNFAELMVGLSSIAQSIFGDNVSVHIVVE